jgi:hypothetical protein
MIKWRGNSDPQEESNEEENDSPSPSHCESAVRVDGPPTGYARHSFWAMELLERRDAVARWRGQTSCTIREVIQAINGLPA